MGEEGVSRKVILELKKSILKRSIVGRAFLAMKIACAKALRKDCAWCVGGIVPGLEWEESRWERRAGSRFCRSLWSVVKSQDFILRAVGSQKKVSSGGIWSDF